MALAKFKNEPLTDFTKKKNVKEFKKALKKIEPRFKQEYPLSIGTEKLCSDDKLKSYNPSNHDEIVGTFQRATVEQAMNAIEIANIKFSE